MSLFYGNETTNRVISPEQLQAFLPPEKKHHYRDGYSMAETAKLWVSANGRLPPCVAAIVGSDHMTRAHFEYGTRVWGGGEGKTDVMVIRDGDVIAIEAKVTESFDLIVSDWIVGSKKPASPPRRAKVAEKYALAFKIQVEVIHCLRYQLLQRTLCAALTARKHGVSKAWMIVQSFCADHASNSNKADFDHFVTSVGSCPTLEGVAVALDWANSTPVERRVP